MAVDYGTDVNAYSDLPLRWALTNGTRNVINAIVRRLTTTRGALAVIGEDPDYGLDIRNLLGESFTPATIAKWRADIAQECEKDERVQHTDVTITQIVGGAIITISVTLADGSVPFSFVLSLTNLTVTLLEAA
jgi:phage baseplate assembly protein W